MGKKWILNDEYAAEWRPGETLKIFAYFKEGDEIRQDPYTGAVVLDMQAYRNLSGDVCAKLEGCDMLNDARRDIKELQEANEMLAEDLKAAKTCAGEAVRLLGHIPRVLYHQLPSRGWIPGTSLTIGGVSELIDIVREKLHKMYQADGTPPEDGVKLAEYRQLLKQIGPFYSVGGADRCKFCHSTRSEGHDDGCEWLRVMGKSE